MAEPDDVVWRLKEVGAERWIHRPRRGDRSFTDDQAKALHFVSEAAAMAAARRFGQLNVEAVAGPYLIAGTNNVERRG